MSGEIGAWRWAAPVTWAKENHTLKKKKRHISFTYGKKRYLKPPQAARTAGGCERLGTIKRQAFLLPCALIGTRQRPKSASKATLPSPQSGHTTAHRGKQWGFLPLLPFSLYCVLVFDMMFSTTTSSLRK